MKKLRRLFGRVEVADDTSDPDGADDDPEVEAESSDQADESADASEPLDLAKGDGEDDPDAAEDEVDADSDVDDEREADSDDESDDEHGEPTGQVEFELADWGARERQLLDSELDAVRVRRAWEASTLVVAASDADVVDDLIDIIEERIALDLPSDVEPVIYEVGDWPTGLEDRFVDALIEERIAHLRGYREVTVGVGDEERVDQIVDEVTSEWEDEQPDPDSDEPDAQEVLSELFVGSDRLLHDPSDKPATVRFDDAAGLVADMAVPFGFDESDWGTIAELVSTLRERLDDADATDDEVVEAATDLRTHLRPLV